MTVIAVVLALASLAMMAGWVFRIPGIVGALPGHYMVFNTALGFFLAGLALLCGNLRERPRRRAQTALCATIVVLFALILAEHVSGRSLGIDWPALHLWLPDSNPAPGRSSAITCAGLLLFSAALILVHHVKGRAAVFAVRGLTAAVAALGVLALVGELLDFDAIFDVAIFRQVPLSTAAGFVLLALGLWLGWRGASWNITYFLHTEDSRIVFAGALIATSIAAAAGISGMAILQASAERMLDSGLAAEYRSRARVFELVVADRGRAIESIARRVNIVRLHSELAEDPGKEAHIAFLNGATRSWLEEGMSFLEFRDHRGERIASGGRPAARGGFEVRLPGREPRWLLWDNGLVLRIEAPIRDGEATVGFIAGEHPLPDLAKIVLGVDETSATGEAAVCAALNRERMSCLPTRFAPRPFDLGRLVRGMPLPMSLALDGRQDVIRALDYRGRDVIAAYGPIGDLGLGMVVKVDASELYAPVRERLYIALPLLLVLIASGTWLLRALVQPLARGMVESQENLRKNEERLAFDRNLLRAVIDNLPDPVFAKDLSVRYLVNNTASQAQLGVASEAETIGRVTGNFFPPDLARMVHEEDEQVMRSGEPVLNRERRLSLGGKERWVLVTKVPLRDVRGGVTGMVGITRDITQQRQAEQALRMREQQLKLALDSARLALWDFDVESGKVYASEQWNAILGGAPEASHTTLAALEKLVHPDDLPPLRAHLYEVLKGNARMYDTEHRVMTYSGEWKWIHSQGRVIERGAEGRAKRMIGVNADIDRRKQAELLLEHQAGHDALTGLPNRKLFHDRLARAIARSDRRASLMAVMYLDIDRFKSINDTHGHDMGDELLKSFAKRLASCVRSTDTVARLGGDEFTVILEELGGREDGCQIAEKIVVAMQPEFTLEGRTLNITTSVGVAFYGGVESGGAHALIRKADEALYAAKGAGRNQYRIAK